MVYVTSLNSVASLSSFLSNIHPFHRSSIASLIVKEISTKVCNKYVDFPNIFSSDLTSELSEHTEINNYTIDLVNSQQLHYKPLYSLKPVELETLKVYIETNPANRFIKLSMLLTSIFILFVQKSNRSLWLDINYRSLNNLTIKNWYPLLLI